MAIAYVRSMGVPSKRPSAPGTAIAMAGAGAWSPSGTDGDGEGGGSVTGATGEDPLGKKAVLVATLNLAGLRGVPTRWESWRSGSTWSGRTPRPLGRILVLWVQLLLEAGGLTG